MRCSKCKELGLSTERMSHKKDGTELGYCSYHCFQNYREGSFYPFVGTSLTDYIEFCKKNNWTLTLPPSEYWVWDAL